MWDVIWIYIFIFQRKVSPTMLGGVPRVVVSTAAFHARVRGSVPVSAVLKILSGFLLLAVTQSIPEYVTSADNSSRKIIFDFQRCISNLS